MLFLFYYYLNSRSQILDLASFLFIFILNNYELKNIIENSNDIQNSTYRKVFSTIILGKVLNQLEYEVLLRGGCNFETTFSTDDLKGEFPDVEILNFVFIIFNLLSAV